MGTQSLLLVSKWAAKTVTMDRSLTRTEELPSSLTRAFWRETERERERERERMWLIEVHRGRYTQILFSSVHLFLSFSLTDAYTDRFMNNGTNRYPITIVLEEDDDDDEEEDDDVVHALSPPRARSTLQVCFGFASVLVSWRQDHLFFAFPLAFYHWFHAMEQRTGRFCISYSSEKLYDLVKVCALNVYLKGTNSPTVRFWYLFWAQLQFNCKVSDITQFGSLIWCSGMRCRRPYTLLPALHIYLCWMMTI